MPVHHNDVVLSELYNDDLPHEKVMDFLKSDNPGLIILHGEPGTGKTSYIRHLIEQFPDNKFMLLDSSMFNHITDASFIHLLLDNPNTAIILEDCEAMVTEDARDMRTNNISTLLNLTDGIIGDSFNMKFICTFNTEVSKIDSALLRKGRLKLKYEFTKLKKDKIEAIAAKRGLTLPKAEDMTLADIMNYGDANGGENKKPNAIGFVQ